MDRTPFKAIHKPRPQAANGGGLKPGVAEHAGKILTLRCAFALESDHARYPGEIALENPDRSRDVFGQPWSENSLGWIASGDVERLPWQPATEELAYIADLLDEWSKARAVDGVKHMECMHMLAIGDCMREMLRLAIAGASIASSRREG